MIWKTWFEPKPYNEGFLPEADGHKVYFREYGNKNGEPVVITHGGPGGNGCKCSYLKPFNLKKYRVINKKRFSNIL